MAWRLYISDQASREIDEIWEYGFDIFSLKVADDYDALIRQALLDIKGDRTMQTIKVDDNTYSAWKKQAAAQGLSVEDWLKQKTANSQSEVDPRKPEELTFEEWKARFDAVMATIEKMNIRSEGGIDWSRDVIYGERGW